MLPVGDPVGELSSLRAATRVRLSGYPEETVVDVLLIMDVLFIEAIRWGHRPRQVRLRAEQATRRLRIEVDSASPDLRIATVEVIASTGLGRLLLEDLPRAWGVIAGQHNKIAWAELATARRSALGAAMRQAAGRAVWVSSSSRTRAANTS